MFYNQFLFSLNFYSFIILGFIFVIIFPLIISKLNKKILWKIYFFIYFLLLLIGVFSFIKFDYQTIKFFLLIDTSYTKSWSIASFDHFGILVNLFLLFPLGVSIPHFNRKLSFAKIGGIGLFTSTSIEILQFILPIVRYPELLDIINNTFSVILGYTYYLLIRRVNHDWISN